MVNKVLVRVQTLEKEVAELNAFRNSLDYDKLLKMSQNNFEMLKKYIDEASKYAKDEQDRLNNKMNLKADSDTLDKFVSAVDSKIISELQRKIDKIELKRTQNFMRKRINQLEDKM